MTISLSAEQQTQAIASIKRYFTENLDEEAGDLQALLLLEYFLTEIGPVVYNQAIAAAQTYFQEKTMDLDGSCYEEEFGFWRQKGD